MLVISLGSWWAVGLTVWVMLSCDRVKGALGKVSGWTGGAPAKPKEYQHRQPQAQQAGGGRGGRKSVPHGDDDVVVTRAADVLTEREVSV